MANILIVDDQRDGREFMSTLLGYRGHSIVAAKDGEEALKLIQTTPPDLVVADILMPKVDGYELVRRMRADPSVAATPVIFYSAGFEDASARELAASVGVIQFLRKPSDPEVILGIIDAALGETRPVVDPPKAPQGFEQKHRELLADSLTRRVDELQQELAERKLAEAKIQALADALALSNHRLSAEIAEREAAQEQLLQARKIESLGELTGGIAHDFNNLLTIVLGSIDLIEKRNKDVSLIRLLDGAREASKRGARLTQQLLAFARKQRLQLTALDLGLVLAELSELLASTVGVGVRIQVSGGSGGWCALGDRNQVEMIMLNLAANARDAMAGDGALTLALGQCTVTASGPNGLAPGDYVTLSVQDDGAGMTEEVQRRAVEPFFTTKGIGKGTGLGLSMVYGVAKQSGGAVAITSASGKGTTVTIHFPRASSGEAGVCGDRTASPPVSRRGRVLLVDDDAKVRAFTEEVLVELGYTVLATEGGEQALGALDAGEAVDLVLLDFAMPGMNGGEVARHVRRRWPFLPILFITGYATGLDTADHSDLPILRKPFSLEQFEAAVAGAIDTTSAVRAMNS